MQLKAQSATSATCTIAEVALRFYTFLKVLHFSALANLTKILSCALLCCTLRNKQINCALLRCTLRIKQINCALLRCTLRIKQINCAFLCCTLNSEKRNIFWLFFIVGAHGKLYCRHFILHVSKLKTKCYCFSKLVKKKAIGFLTRYMPLFQDQMMVMRLHEL